MRDSEILEMLKNDCPMCGPVDCACTATEQDQYREIQRLTLTDEERLAVAECIKFAFPASHPTAATLRALLERTK